MPLPDGDSSVGHSFGLEFDGVMIKSITEISGLKIEQDVVEFALAIVVGRKRMDTRSGQIENPSNIARQNEVPSWAKYVRSKDGAAVIRIGQVGVGKAV